MLQSVAPLLIHDDLVLLIRGLDLLLLLGFLQRHIGMQHILDQLLAEVQVDRPPKACVELRLEHVLLNREPQLRPLQKWLPYIKAVIVITDHHLDVCISSEAHEPVLERQ